MNAILQVVLVLVGLATVALVIGFGAGLATRRDGDRVVWALVAAGVAIVTLGAGMALLFASAQAPLAFVLLTVGAAAACYAAIRMSPPMSTPRTEVDTYHSPASSDDLIPTPRATAGRIRTAAKRGKPSRGTSRATPTSASSSAKI